jgi:hypothetical protein
MSEYEQFKLLLEMLGVKFTTHEHYAPCDNYMEVVIVGTKFRFNRAGRFVEVHSDGTNSGARREDPIVWIAPSAVDYDSPSNETLFTAQKAKYIPSFADPKELTAHLLSIGLPCKVCYAVSSDTCQSHANFWLASELVDAGNPPTCFKEVQIVDVNTSLVITDPVAWRIYEQGLTSARVSRVAIARLEKAQKYNIPIAILEKDTM